MDGYRRLKKVEEGEGKRREGKGREEKGREGTGRAKGSEGKRREAKRSEAKRRQRREGGEGKREGRREAKRSLKNVEEAPVVRKAASFSMIPRDPKGKFFLGSSTWRSHRAFNVGRLVI